MIKQIYCCDRCGKYQEDKMTTLILYSEMEVTFHLCEDCEKKFCHFASPEGRHEDLQKIVERENEMPKLWEV